MRVGIIVATFGDPEWELLATERAVPSALAEYERSDACVGVCHIHSPEGSLAQARNEAARSFMVPGESGRIRIASLAHPEDAQEFDVHGGQGADWLCFLDADDELEPGYIDAMVEALKTHRILHAPVTEPRSYFEPPEALLVPKVRRVWGGELRSSLAPEIPNKGRWPNINECCIGTLVARVVFDMVGGFRDHTDDGTSITMYEDWDLWLRCFDSGARLVYTDAVYREHVSTGRNTNAHDSQAMYDAIWRDHEARQARKQLEWMTETERIEREVFPDARPRGEIIVPPPDPGLS